MTTNFLSRFTDKISVVNKDGSATRVTESGSVLKPPPSLRVTSRVGRATPGPGNEDGGSLSPNPRRQGPRPGAVVDIFGAVPVEPGSPDVSVRSPRKFLPPSGLAPGSPMPPPGQMGPPPDVNGMGPNAQLTDVSVYSSGQVLRRPPGVSELHRMSTEGGGDSSQFAVPHHLSAIASPLPF
ncbi:hypothetical protein T492DRAFT_120409 [Pavlovales sp. CCMP2436]|nr:hypothetical protein T492DRAFT_120409 [Pavlovales sp. CCMP2436]